MSKPYPIVDAHHHWVPQSHLERLEAFMGPGESVRRRPNGSTRSSLMRNGEDIYNMDEAVVANTEARLKDMDEAGVDVAVLQLGIWLEFLNLETARETNDELARVQRESNDRLIGLAHVPPMIEGAEEELDRAVRELGLRGVNLTTHWRGIYPDEPACRKFFRKVAELDVPVVIHASSSSGLSAPLDGDGTHWGRVADMTTIVVRLMKSDLLDELPTLRFMLPQLGGSFFAVLRRLKIELPGSTLGVQMHKLRNNLWFDTAGALWDTPDYTLAVANLGANRLVMGSDYPSSRYFMTRTLEKLGAVPMSDADRETIMHGNAAKLFGL